MLPLKLMKKVTNDLFKYTNTSNNRVQTQTDVYCLDTSGNLLLSQSVYFEFFSTHFRLIFDVIKDK